MLHPHMKPGAEKDSEVKEDIGVPKAEDIIWIFFKPFPSNEYNFTRETNYE